MSDLALTTGSAVRWRGPLAAEDLKFPEICYVSLKSGGDGCVGSVSAAHVCNSWGPYFELGKNES